MTIKRRERGMLLAEMTASIALMVPLVFVLIFVTMEISTAYFLRTTMAEGARTAARNLAIAYGQDPTITESRSQQNSQVFDNIRIKSVINASEQFDDPVFNTAVTPHTVAVTVRYLSDKYGLPQFPHPDPLHLGAKFQIVANATYRLE